MGTSGSHDCRKGWFFGLEPDMSLAAGRFPDEPQLRRAIVVAERGSGRSAPADAVAARNAGWLATMPGA